MISKRLLIYCSLLIAFTFPSVLGQGDRERQEQEAVAAKSSVETPSTGQSASNIRQLDTIHLVGGGQMYVEEVSESGEGFWYKRGNISTFIDRTKVARIERYSELIERTNLAPIQPPGRWRLSDAPRVKEFFLATFKRHLPLSAFGQSELHDRWGLDHRNGMDVNLHPDSVEGRALIAFLREQSIPFLSFRGPVPRVATGPHIHIGNPSSRVAVR